MCLVRSPRRHSHGCGERSSQGDGKDVPPPPGQAKALTAEVMPDGTGRITIRFSETDQFGEGATLVLAAETVQDLEAIRPDVYGQRDAIFSLCSASLSRRVGKACLFAGAGDGFTGHSGRVGMVIDLAAVDTGLPDLMKAGRWDSPVMPLKAVARCHRIDRTG